MIAYGAVGLDAALEACRFLRQYFPATRLIRSESLSQLVGGNVYLKLETELPTGTFKVRAALYALSKRLEATAIQEVVASSTGNHGAAVAYAGQVLKLPVTIFLPKNASTVKRARIRGLGGRIVEEGVDSAEAAQLAAEYARREGIYLLDDATDPIVPIATGTIAYEILATLPNLSEIYVPIGDSALIRGIAAVTKQVSPDVRIIGVQATGAPAYYLSFKAKKSVNTPTCKTVAAGLATRRTHDDNVRACTDLVSDICLVTDDQMVQAIGHLLLKEQILAEPAGAASTAALIQATVSHGQNIVLIVSGSNVSEEVLRRAVGRAGSSDSTS